MENQANKQGSVKIGRSGTKLHPAFIDPRYGLIIQCSCPGTQQGSAYKGARFFENVAANCNHR
jgi:hypothetical protein